MEISMLGFKLNLEVLILIGVLYLILVGHMFCSCCNVSGLMEGLKGMVNERRMKEGFVGASTNNGMSSPYSLGDYSPVDTSNWGSQSLVVSKDQNLSPTVKSILDRPEQPVPLPEGEMLMFANTPFKPECCPSSYSNSKGCACMTTGQYNYLIARGGNNAPYSEY